MLVINTNRLLFYILFLTVFQHFLYNLIPVEFLGISFFLFLFLLLVFFLFTLKIKFYNKKDVFFYFIFLVFYVFVSFIKHSTFPTSSSFINKLITNFSWYLIPIIIFISKNNNKIFQRKFERFLFIFLVFQAILSLLFILNLPTINLLTENHTPNYSRYVGMFGGANVNANINSLIVAVLVLGSNKFSFLKKLFIILLGTLSVMPSLSRLALIIIIILLFYIIFDFFKKKIKSLIWLIMPLITLFSFILLKNNIELLSDFRTIMKIFSTIESGGDLTRLDKYSYGISILSDNINSILIGPPSYLQFGLFITVSDNSFIQMPLSLGVPLFILFVLLVVRLLKFSLITYNLKSRIYLFILFITLFLNNAVVWIPWLFIYFLGYWKILKKSKTLYKFQNE